MNLESIRTIFKAPGIIGDKPNLTTSRSSNRKARRVVILYLIVKNENISKAALIKMCYAMRIGEYSTIVRDITYFVKNSMVKIIVTPVKTHNLVAV